MKFGLTISFVCISAMLFAPSLGLTRDPVDGPNPPRFSMGRVSAFRGDEVVLPLRINSEYHLSMVSWSVEYDPEVLEFLGPAVTQEVLDMLNQVLGGKSDFQWHVNEEEGYIQTSLVFDFLGRENFALPPRVLASIAALTFRVKESAPAGFHPISFTRPETARYNGHFHSDRGPIFNAARRHGRTFTDESRFEEITQPDLEDGVLSVSIIGDVGIFVRGDANLDIEVNISDPVMILDFLFLGGNTPGCKDAADANLDGKIDVSDPVRILDFLFNGTTSWSPTTEVINNESPVSLGCSQPL